MPFLLLPRRRAFLGTALSALALPFLARPAAAQGEGAPLPILATTAMLGDLAGRIGGPRIRLEVLMGEGVDPHLYRPSREDMARLPRASLVLAHGLGLEGRMAPALARPLPVATLSEEVPPANLLPAEAGQDPHLWMDLSLWSLVAARIATRLKALDPAGAPLFEANLSDLQEELRSLDAWAIRTIPTIPEPRRVLVTAHGAFAYFARRYGIEALSLQGTHPEAEPSPRRIREMADMLAARGIGTVFLESSLPDRPLRAVIEAAAARGHRVVIGGELYTDAMGGSGTYEGSYPGMMDHNLATITRALGGEAPERGFAGRLARVS
ncbi:zinc ABC transporter substrate-binding protein [Roseomonas sp. GC11]|uniref:metal ABC transporter solute-binding protein, Zn/Mn family n=1 Tax=Roseomonas sp. GC11 TaxID=2950546 RepID=UPI00210DA5FA|nr:zinc ABC transporter substrate-binding protein [Roseomonas sp. GC11]MCQ4162031.1 zinc ABC transporter substrate-binding protein [Roseomonas sp. GC11]